MNGICKIYKENGEQYNNHGNIVKFYKNNTTAKIYSHTPSSSHPSGIKIVLNNLLNSEIIDKSLILAFGKRDGYYP